VDLFGQILLDRRAAVLFEGKELAKRCIRAFLPIRRFRKSTLRRLKEIEPDPKYAVRPCGSRTPAVFVAVCSESGGRR
jgi:hypothetical protein